jgi:hypothetical protein
MPNRLNLKMLLEAENVVDLGSGKLATDVLRDFEVSVVVGLNDVLDLEKSVTEELGVPTSEFANEFPRD